MNSSVLTIPWWRSVSTMVCHWYVMVGKQASGTSLHCWSSERIFFLVHVRVAMLDARIASSHIMLHLLLQRHRICSATTSPQTIAATTDQEHFRWKKDTSIPSMPQYAKTQKGHKRINLIWLHLFHKHPFRSRSVVLDLFHLQTSHAWGRKRKFPILTTVARISTTSVNLHFQLQQKLTFQALRTLTASWVSPKELAHPKSWSLQMMPHPTTKHMGPNRILVPQNLMP